MPWCGSDSAKVAAARPRRENSGQLPRAGRCPIGKSHTPSMWCPRSGRSRRSNTCRPLDRSSCRSRRCRRSSMCCWGNRFALSHRRPCRFPQHNRALLLPSRFPRKSRPSSSECLPARSNRRSHSGRTNCRNRPGSTAALRRRTPGRFPTGRRCQARRRSSCSSNTGHQPLRNRCRPDRSLTCIRNRDSMQFLRRHMPHRFPHCRQRTGRRMRCWNSMVRSCCHNTFQIRTAPRSTQWLQYSTAGPHFRKSGRCRWKKSKTCCSPSRMDCCQGSIAGLECHKPGRCRWRNRSCRLHQPSMEFQLDSTAGFVHRTRDSCQPRPRPRQGQLAERPRRSRHLRSPSARDHR